MCSEFSKKRDLVIMATALLTGLAFPSCASAPQGINSTVKRETTQDTKTAPNLLPNPSFEETEGTTVRGWTSRAWSGKENGLWSVEEAGRTGKHCLFICSRKGVDAAWTATVTVKPDTFYRLSGWIKTENIRGALGALLNIQHLHHAQTQPVTGTKEWTLVSTVFNSGSMTRLEINCLYGGWGTSTGKAWYDDVSLREAPPPAYDATHAILTIDDDAPSVAYSRLLFGGFIEHFHRQVYGGLFDPDSPLSDGRGFRRDVIEALKELRISIVRWPGGCFASGYNWKDGVGSDRRPVPDPVWGVTDANTFGTVEFVEWCRRINSEPYICTNAGSGTPKEMQEWVEYCNRDRGRYAELRRSGRHEEQLRVRYWSIGNENWGGHEIGAKKPEEWGPLVRRSAELMLEADPGLVLLAAATPDRNWTLPLLKAAGKYLDYICIHKYWLGFWQRNAMPGYRSCIMLSEGPENTITRVIDILEEAGFRTKIKIAFDEWNLRGWHHPGFPRKKVTRKNDEAAVRLINRRDLNAIASQYTMADALFSASFLNSCLRHADVVGMANIAPLVNTRGPLYVHAKGIVKRTTFHTLCMYANLLETQVSRLTLDVGRLFHGSRSIPVIDAIATKDSPGRRWAIALVNRHPSKEVACTIRRKDAPVEGTYDATILAGDSPDAFNDIEHPDRVVPVKTRLVFRKGVIGLPPHSLTIVKLLFQE